MTHSGASLAPLWSQPQTFAHQVAGVILHSNTLISLSLSSCALLNTELELSLYHTEGKLNLMSLIMPTKSSLVEKSLDLQKVVSC